MSVLEDEGPSGSVQLSQNGDEICDSTCNSAKGNLSVCTIQQMVSICMCQAQCRYNNERPGCACEELPADK